MRALLQRVSRAEVRVAGESVGRIGPGLAILLGVGRDDDEDIAEDLARKVSTLRIFRDQQGRTDRSILDVGGAALVVSQFTLYADTRHGRRPGFTGAAEPGQAERCYRRFAEALGQAGITVATGRFGAEMAVDLSADGPFTIWLDTGEGAKAAAGGTEAPGSGSVSGIP